jgi:hypothetical protein
MECLQFRGHLLAPLQGLNRLHTLSLSADDDVPVGAVQALCQLTRLQQLALDGPGTEGLFMRLTQLRRLTRLEFEGLVDHEHRHLTRRTEVSHPLIACLLLAYLSFLFCC